MPEEIHSPQPDGTSPPSDAVGIAPVRAPMPPMFPWAVGIICGILIDCRCQIPLDWSLASLGVVAPLLLVPIVRRRLTLPVAAILACCIGAILHHHAFYVLPANDIATYTSPEPRIARLGGRVAGRPRMYSPGSGPFTPWMFDHDRTSFLLAVDRIETKSGWSAAQGLVRVIVKEPALAVQDGASVEAFGILYRPLEPRNPGAFDWQRYNARRGIRAGLSCRHAENITVTQHSESRPTWTLRRLRQQVRRLLLSDRVATGGDEVSLLDAMVLGRREGMDRHIEQSFVDTGCAHYLAVSGLHVGMLAAVIWAPCRLLGAGRRWSALLVMAAVCAYALLADPRPPILRAAVMTCAYCVMLLTRRRQSTMGAMSLAAVVLLVADPTSLFDIGFQLSFITVTGIVLLSPIATRAYQAAATRRLAPVSAFSDDPSRLPALIRDRQHTWRYRIGRTLFTALGVAIIAWLCALPIVAVHFGRVSPWGWLNSLIALPFVFAVMVLGFAKLAASVLIPVLAGPIGAALNGATHLLLVVMDGLVRLPGSTVSLPSPPWWVCVAYYGVAAVVIGWWVGLLSRRQTAAIATLCAGICAGWWCVPTAPSGLLVTQFAVGRGTSTVIELPDGRVWIYDAGTSGSFDPGKSAIIPYLRFRNTGRISGIIISHPNLDHFGGVPSILDACSCDHVYVPPQFDQFTSRTSPTRELMRQLDLRGYAPEALDCDTTINMGAGIEAEILWPKRSVPTPLNANDISVVMRISYQSRSVLFTGDIGDAAQQWLIENANLTADVLILPHHGAIETSTEVFVEAVNPTYIVRSSFVRNEESAELASLIGARRLLNTADAGAVEIELKGGEVSVQGFLDR